MQRISATDGLSLEAPQSVLELDSPNGLRGAELDPKRLAASIFEQQHLPVCRYLVSLGLRQAVASEIVQEAFLRLYRHLRSRGRSENLRGWVFRVAHNLAVNELKRSGAAEAEELGTEADPGGDPEQVLLRKERMGRMQAAIRALPRRQQECLHLRAEGLRYREIAEALGIGVSSVAESVQRAMETLARSCHE
jgi:RNA polymerase sigma-70 factor (ECF subfamily)